MRCALGVLFLLAACGGVTERGDGIDAGDPPPDDCDADDDGFFNPHPACDVERAGAPPDCDEARDDVFPGAPTICEDGAVNNCAELAEVSATLGVAEFGVIADDAVFLTGPGGFFNNVSVAAAPDADPIVMIAGAESASTPRLLRVRLSDPGNPTVMTVSLAGTNFANNDTSVVHLGNGVFRLGTMVSSMGNRGALGDFTVEDVAVNMNVPTADATCINSSQAPFVITGLNNAGLYVYELTDAANAVLQVAAADPQSIRCRSLSEIGLPFDEFGSQLVATGSMALGRAPNGVWVWEQPDVFNDLFAYDTSAPILGAADFLGRNNASGDPVLMAFRSPGGLTIESMDCAGLGSCSRVGATDLPVGGEMTRVALAPLARGAVLVRAVGADFSSPQTLQLAFLDENGAILSGSTFLDMVSYDPNDDAELRDIDLAMLPPSVGRPFHELIVGVSIAKRLSDQAELRLVRGIACQDP